MEFYKILQEIMVEMNLSIPEVARKANLSDSTVRSIIKRKSKSVALDVAVKISKGLGVTLERLNGDIIISDLKELNESQKKQQSSALTITTEPDKTIIRKFLQLSERNKYRIEGKIDDYLTDEQQAATKGA